MIYNLQNKHKNKNRKLISYIDVNITGSEFNVSENENVDDSELVSILKNDKDH